MFPSGSESFIARLKRQLALSVGGNVSLAESDGFLVPEFTMVESALKELTKEVQEEQCSSSTPGTFGKARMF